MNRTILEKIKNLKNQLLSTKLTAKVIFLLMGIGSTIWFLIRVIPKPQRAGYPCMKAAAPVMSGFVTYLLTLTGSMIFLRKAVSKMKQARYISAGLAVSASLLLILAFNFNDAKKVFADPTEVTWTRGVLPDGPNNPMGTGWGIFPGRVAWVRSADATNENCTNTYTLTGSGWNKKIDWENSNVFTMAKNNNQDVINDMADKSILAVGGKTTVKDSWDAIFKSFNNKRKGKDTGYTEGQTIFIKINNGQAGWAINMSDMTETAQSSASTGTKNIAMSNSTPASVLAYIRQLVDSCGIPQNKIYVGEPMTHVYKSFYDLIHDNYPGVIVLDKENHTNLGRTTTSGWHSNAIVYSDKGTEMPDAISDGIMNEMYDADYMINMAALKAHARGGVTLNAKLHFGSHNSHGTYTWGSFYLHEGLICTVDNDVMTSGVRGEYGMYRVLTDIMGNEKLGLNTVLFIVDGLWGGIEATDMPVHWKTAPFNNDFPNSLFVSQDEVALESVCIDFLRSEANVNTAFKDRPFFPAVDDYLHQAADKANWAAGITYDPEGDGTEMPASLGVHEHWNNDTDKQYSKNLDPVNGKGIELYSIDLSSTGTGVKQHSNFISGVQVYPNPCTDYAMINFAMQKDAVVELSVLTASGKTVQKYRPMQRLAGQQTQQVNTSNWARGSYIVVMKSTTNSGSEISTSKFMVN